MEKIKVGAIIPKIKLGNPLWNAEELITQIKKANLNGIHVIATPELTLSGASCGDLFYHDIFIKNCMQALKMILEETKDLEIICLIGMPLKVESDLFNVTVAIQKGNLLGIIPKKKLNDNEKRWFTCGKHIPEKIRMFEKEVFTRTNCFLVNLVSFQVIMGELIDIASDDTSKVIFHITSNYELVGKTEKLINNAKMISAKNHLTYVYVSPGIGESSANVVYSGYSFICQNGIPVSQTEKYCFESSVLESNLNEKESTDIDKIELLSEEEKKKQKESLMFPFIPQENEALKRRCEEIIKMQAAALLRRLKQVRSNKTVIGLSGGSDSTLAFLAIIEAYKMGGIDNRNLIAITMPGFGTTSRTYENALALAKKYGTTLREISIKKACMQHYQDIGLYENDKGIAFENAQARERTQILMDIANLENALVIGTGDLSELALGWCTYNGDHMSMYSVNSGIPKTLIKEIIRYKAEMENDASLKDILETPISPELLPPDENGNIAQKTESTIGPYELHDYFLYHFLRYHSSPKEILNMATKAFEGRYEREEIRKWLLVFLSRFFTQQFKRNCVPDGPKIGSVGLGPRGDFVFPSDADKSLWTNMLEEEEG